MTPKFEKMQQKDMQKCNDCDYLKGKECRKHKWEEYEDIMEGKITKMWRALGVTDRDWTKYKVVFFNEKSQLCCIPKDKFRAQEQEKKKLEAQAPPTLNAKQKKTLMEKKFALQHELVERHLKQHDQ